MAAKDTMKEPRKLWGGFWSSRVLLTANNLGVFDYLKTPKTAEALAKTLKADARATEILLDAITALGLLKKSAGKYRNNSVAGDFLVKGSPYYQGDILRHAETLWQNWSGLDEVVRTGSPSRKAHDHESFIKGMHNIAQFKAKDVIDAIGTKGVKSALDLGGGPGTYTMQMARRGVATTLFDMPETIKIAKKIIRKSGLGAIDYLSGDFMSADIKGGYDLVFISQVLHSYSADDNVKLLEKCRRALNPGGRIAVQEFYLDKSRTSPVQGALFSVNMLVNTGGGRSYTPAEVKRFLKKAGFKSAKEKMLDDTVLVTASR